ncbi:MAG TPA: hypothetical protein VM925_09500 [Labilithrix sp.]|nr:hypothetical protein [Labilithrix sp.]
MKASCLTVLFFATMLGACADETGDPPAASDESEVIGDSAAEILMKLEGQGIKEGVSDKNSVCGMRVLADDDGPRVAWSYDSIDPDDYLNAVRAREFKVALLARKMTVRREYGDSYLFPCKWGGSSCSSEETTVEYDKERRITKISTVLNDVPKGSCTFETK